MLTFNLKKEWFDKIKSGEKTHEYREMSEHWCKRLGELFEKSSGKNYFEKEMEKYWKETNITKHIFHQGAQAVIKFALGYPKAEEKEKFLYAFVKSLTVGYPGNFTDLKIERPIFDIEFELIQEGK